MVRDVGAMACLARRSVATQRRKGQHSLERHTTLRARHAAPLQEWDKFPHANRPPAKSVLDAPDVGVVRERPGAGTRPRRQPKTRERFRTALPVLTDGVDANPVRHTITGRFPKRPYTEAQQLVPCTGGHRGPPLQERDKFPHANRPPTPRADTEVRPCGKRGNSTLLTDHPSYGLVVTISCLRTFSLNS